MGEYPQMYAEHLRTPEMFRQPSELGLRSIAELEAAPSAEVVAAFDAAKAVMIMKGGKGFGSSHSPEMAAKRGCKEYMEHCFAILIGRKDSKALYECFDTMESHSKDINEIYGLISPTCGKDVETLKSEARKQWTSSGEGSQDAWMLDKAIGALGRVIREATNTP